MSPLTNTVRNHWTPLFVCLFAFFAAAHGNCTAPPRLDFGELKPEFIDQTSFAVNANVTYNCRPGYSRVPGISNALFCLSDSTWSTPGTFCTLRSCGSPGDILNGEMHATDFLFGSRVNYTCNEGYLMQSKKPYRECLADGTWSNNVPDCQIQECATPIAITDGSYIPNKVDYVYQDVVTYKCNNNTLSLIGEASIFCTSHGNWSADPPKCIVVECPDPSVPNSMKLSGFNGPYTLNSAVRFQCSQGFVMSGSASVTCNASSMWNPPLPSCNSSAVTQKPSTTKPNETGGVTQKPATGNLKETGITVTQKPTAEKTKAPETTVTDPGDNVGAIVGLELVKGKNEGMETGGIIAGIVLCLAAGGGVWWYMKRRGGGGGGGGNASSLGNNPDGGKSSSHQKPKEQRDTCQIQAQETV